MSDVRGLLRRAFVMTAVLVLPSGSADAQTVAEYSQRVDSLARAWQLEQRADQIQDSLRVLALPLDTIRIGPLVILTDSAHAPLARATGERLESFLDLRYGMFAHRLSRTPFIIRGRLARAGEPETVESGVVDSVGELHVLSVDYAEPKWLAVSWQNKIAAVLTTDLPPEIQSWLSGALPPTAPGRSSSRQARAVLALSGTQAARECAGGATERCVQALGLIPVADPAFALFDARGRQRMAAAQRRVLRDLDSTTFDRCVAAKQYAACDVIARSIAPEIVPPALPPSARVNVLEFALSHGSRGAFDRLVVTPGAIRVRLEAAAGESVDSLVSQWRAAAMDGPENATSLDGETAISSLFWAALCGGLALRSSRWR